MFDPVLFAALMGSTALFSPSSLFSAGEQGAWYDPSDLTTMFQESTGVTPVTAVEQPVGLILDKSKGLTLGSELVTNGTFDTNTTGWTLWQTGILSVDNFRLKVENGAATISGAYQLITVVVGRTYKFEGVKEAGTALSPRYYLGTSVGGTQYASNATSGQVFIATSTTLVVTAATQSTVLGATAFFDNISVKELAGNHASQSTSASRPVLSATSKIDFDGTDDKWTGTVAGGGTTGFLFVAGVNIDVTGSNQTLWSDTGTNTGYRVRINSSNQVELAAGNGAAFTAVVTTETLSAGTNYVIAAWHDGTNLNVSLSGGAVASQAFATASAGTTTFTVGMDNGAVSSQLNGKVFNAVYVKNFAGSIAAVNNAIAYVNGRLT